ncbi:MAG TPA: tetratricopeptide repeat protein [Gaiellaceae bacterium]|nr:tetratricopeptide repeat protein [Gaiellaceae bacterium]
MASEAPSAETIGERLRRLRLERGLSQRELSAPGVSYAYISRIEAGARRPSVKALRLLARKLGVSAEYLETGSDIHDFERRELRLSDAELRLRIENDVATAERDLTELLREALTAGDAPAAARARVGLGYAAAARGDHPRASELLEQSIDSGLLSPLGRPDVFAALGRSWSALGQPEQAVALFERCLRQIEEEAPGDASSIRFSAYLANALTDLGDYDGAQQALREAVLRSNRIVDPYDRVRLYWSLGRVAGTEGRHQVSLAYFRRALELLETTEDTVAVARAHLSCAWMLIESDQLDEAEAHLAQAQALFGLAPQQIDAVVSARFRAELARRRGDADAAIAWAREAIALAGEALPAERGNAWFAIAETRAAQGSIPEAEQAFAEAAHLLDQHGSTRERAACYRAWGRLLRGAGREAEALDVLERAADFAAESRSRSDR